ncbi:hypothetical protein niasHT_019314 [Heterodera trifolii]|uniref:Uncharacterized protein n=1 Tax=Heterodera trifolii TaxID=157864 RepID=A0ABD2L5F2_9BILA
MKSTIKSELLAVEEGKTIFHGPSEHTLTLEQLISRLEEKIAQTQAVDAHLQPTAKQRAQVVTQLMLVAEEIVCHLIEQRAEDFEWIAMELFTRTKLEPRHLIDKFGPPANAENDEEKEEKDEQMDAVLGEEEPEDEEMEEVQDDEWED